MSEQTGIQSDPTNSVVLQPNPQLPLVITGVGVGSLLLLNLLWLSLVLIIFGLFLLLQSFTLRLEFTPKDLVVKQLGKELRRFPFSNWISWRIFLPSLPGLLYFREKASPHLLPILFDRKMLEKQLKIKVGNLEIPKEDSSKSS